MEFSSIAYDYLKTCGININRTILRTRMQSHPDYPSLLSFTDTMDELGLVYSAVIAEKNNVSQFSYPLLAHIMEKGSFEFLIIKKESDFFTKKEFLKRWDGIAVIAEQSKQVQNERHIVLRTDEQGKNYYIAGALTITYLLLNLWLFSIGAGITRLILFGLSCMGTLIFNSIISLNEGVTTTLTDKLCKTSEREDCKSMINMKSLKIGKYLTVGFVGLMYFLSQVLFVIGIATTAEYTTMHFYLAIPITFAVLISFISLYFQWKIAKAWCRLCLVVILINMLEAIILTIFFNWTMPFEVSLSALQIGFISALLSSVIAIQAIHTKKNYESSIKNHISHLSWKRDANVFLAILKTTKKVDIGNWENEISIGDLSAPIHLIVVSNPYCIPCAKAHNLIEEMQNKFPDLLSVTFRFALHTDIPEDKNTKAVLHLLDAWHKNEKGKDNPLDTWFKTMNLEKMKTEYELDFKEQYFSVVKKYVSWSKENKIIFTPTIFVNGHQYPSKYTINDFKEVITQLADILSVTDQKEKDSYI